MCQQHLKLWVICFYQAEPSWKLESCRMRSKCQESVQKQKHKHLPARMMMIHWTFASLSQWPTIKTLGVYISSRKKYSFNFYYMVLKLNDLPSQVFLRYEKRGEHWSPWESIPRTPMTSAPRKWLCCLMPQGVPLLSLGAWLIVVMHMVVGGIGLWFMCVSVYIYLLFTFDLYVYVYIYIHRGLEVGKTQGGWRRWREQT